MRPVLAAADAAEGHAWGNAPLDFQCDLHRCCINLWEGTRASIDRAQVTMRSPADVRARMDSMAANDLTNTWTVTQLSVMGITVNFHHVHTGEWLRYEYNNAAYKEGFVVRPAKLYVDGERRWTCPADSDAWVELQDDLGGAGVVAALQLYSDKSLLNMKGTSMYPLKAILLNAPLGARMQLGNMQDIAAFPILQQPPGMSDENYKIAALLIHHQCLQIVLEPLKLWSHVGEPMVDPFGAKQVRT